MYEQKRTKRPSSPGTPAMPTRFSASGARGVAPRAD